MTLIVPISSFLLSACSSQGHRAFQGHRALQGPAHIIVIITGFLSLVSYNKSMCGLYGSYNNQKYVPTWNKAADLITNSCQKS